MAEQGPAIPPVVKTVQVRLSPADAFELFAARMGEWWPLATHSVLHDAAATCGIDPCVGGQVFEADRRGARQIWGTVLAYEPPSRLAFTWHPGREPGTAQQVEVRFEPLAAGTRVVLEHRGWEALGAEAIETRTGYDQGWETVFGEHYARAAT